LDKLLEVRVGGGQSTLAWLRQTAYAATSGNFPKLIERLSQLRALGIESERATRVHQNYWLKLAREGGQSTVQHLAELEPLRRYATLTAVVLDLTATLTDEALNMFEHLIGKLFKKSERAHADEFHASGKSINEKVRLYARIGKALIAARSSGGDAFAAIEAVLSWPKFESTVAEAQILAQPEEFDYLGLLNERYGTVRKFAPLLPAFGQDGPYRNRPGFGTLAEAMSGLAAVTGFPDRPPLLPAYPLADVLVGYLGASAILAALMRRERTGVGEIIDLAIYEAALKTIESQVVEYDQNGTLHPPQGNRIGDSAPRGAYRCADGKWLALSASTQGIAERILRVVGGERLVGDERFRTNLDRLGHNDELDALVSDWCARFPREEALAVLDAANCAAGPLENVATMLDNPQVVARESIVGVDDPVLGRIRMSNVYPRFTSVNAPPLIPGAARVGEHTREVLAADLGLDAVEFERLAAAGTFGANGVHAGRPT
jgi:hypothetical protein